MLPTDLGEKLARFWPISARKIDLMEHGYDPSLGSPVFTQQGRYTTLGWTEWTEGFVYGSAILQFDADGDRTFLDIGRRNTVDRMAKHLTHTGVHDHGFNNVSTYGNLLRLMNEGRIEEDRWERRFYELALKCSGAVQAARWTDIGDGDGFIYSFNGPHSLFADTIRSLRSLAVGHVLGQALMGENDRSISLLERLVRHMRTTCRYIVYFGEGRDAYDEAGRVVHEAVFNTNDGNFRCPSTQQGYSPFSTWTRGLAWIMTGYAEQLEFLEGMDAADFEGFGGKQEALSLAERTARATCDFYLANTPTDHIPYWDTGAPGLSAMWDYLTKPADPFNQHEPVDSSAAAIAAQGLMRLGHYLGERPDDGGSKGGSDAGARYLEAGLRILDTLLDEPYLSTAEDHQGLLLHSVYHRPNGWDYVPGASGVPRGESSMWGDYHIREAALYAGRLAGGGAYYTFWP